MVEKRTQQFIVRFNRKEKEVLGNLADFYGMSEAGYIRWVLFKDHRELFDRP